MSTCARAAGATPPSATRLLAALVVAALLSLFGTLALRRFGRFDREIDLGIPDHAGRLEILKIKGGKTPKAEL
ncbi:MAG: hypothetical protein VXW43_19840 [Pseudomonadota bacterium]|nr:hypothetical protein [Pseudomonadota bacterium]